MCDCEKVRACVGKPAPAFEADAMVFPNPEFQKIRLSDYQGRWLVFFFYPLDFTFVCPSEIITFDTIAPELKKLGCEVLACSVDSCFSHFAWCERSRADGGLGNLKIPILSDITKKISRDYGVLIEEDGVALRGLFIIDPQGVLRHITINPLNVGRNHNEVLRMVQALQFVDEHGEVCGADWTPGAKTIKPSISGMKEFFTETYGGK